MDVDFFAAQNKIYWTDPINYKEYSETFIILRGTWLFVRRVGRDIITRHYMHSTLLTGLFGRSCSRKGHVHFFFQFKDVTPEPLTKTLFVQKKYNTKQKQKCMCSWCCNHRYRPGMGIQLLGLVGQGQARSSHLLH